MLVDTDNLVSAERFQKFFKKYVAAAKAGCGPIAVTRKSEVVGFFLGAEEYDSLFGIAVNELLEFEDGTLGLAMNLDEDTVGAVVLGLVDALEEDQVVKATGRILSVPVGDGLLGRTRRRLRGT